MRRLILTTDAAGAGWLQQAKRADRVDVLGQRLVCDRPPTPGETDNFFAPGHIDTSHWLDWRSRGTDRPGLIQTCRDFDSIELWIDPVANAQLVLLQLLDFLSPHDGIIGKLVLRQADSRIAERGPEEFATLTPPAVPIEARHLDTARRAWDAFRQPTPEAWFDLRTRDLDALPALGRSVSDLLAELPAVGSALGTTEAMLLGLIAPGGPPPFYAPGYRRIVDRGIFDTWEVGRMLDRLAQGPTPAVLGLDEGPFDLAMHDDAERFRRYKTSRLSLSVLGHALLEDRDDFAAHNPIHRWWGGTELTNDRLWRWDSTRQTLVAPA